MGEGGQKDIRAFHQDRRGYEMEEKGRSQITQNNKSSETEAVARPHGRRQGL